MMANYSRQRELIKKNLISRHDHPTADAVYHSIREEIPNISLGTVYRNLRFLVEHNELVSIDIGDGKEHFDGNITPHYHFICNQCGNVQDIYLEDLDINKIAAKHFNGKILGHSTYFYGVCSCCLSRTTPFPN